MVKGIGLGFVYATAATLGAVVGGRQGKQAAVSMVMKAGWL